MSHSVSKNNRLLLVKISLVLFLLVSNGQYVRAQRVSPQQLVQQQIDGYNTHNAAEFAAPYSDTTTLYTFPDKVLMRFRTQKEIETYYAKLFEAQPKLHCDVANQMMVGNTVIVHEKISGWTNRPNFDSLVIYHIENDKIVSVHFVKR